MQQGSADEVLVWVLERRGQRLRDLSDRTNVIPPRTET